MQKDADSEYILSKLGRLSGSNFIDGFSAPNSSRDRKKLIFYFVE